MADVDTFIETVMQPGVPIVQPIIAVPFNPVVNLFLTTISGQEAAWIYRRQIPGGQARGLWQFEQGGGCWGVLNHSASAVKATALCQARGVAATPSAVWAALETDDFLALGFARLLLWTDPRALPSFGQPTYMWQQYLDNWRPGKPRVESWDDRYFTSRDAMQSGGLG